jgi:hypothetical protein
LVEKERAAGIEPEVTKARLKALDQIAKDDKLMKEAFAIRGARTEKEKKEALTSLKALTAPGSTKESKQQAQETRLDLAKAVLENQVKKNFVMDVSKWAISDPAIQTAITEVQNAGGKLDMESVLMQYIGTSVGAERRQKVELFTNHALQAAKRSSKSVLGAVNPAMLKKDLESIETRRLVERIQEEWKTIITNPLIPGLTPAIQAQQLLRLYTSGDNN